MSTAANVPLNTSDDSTKKNLQRQTQKVKQNFSTVNSEGEQLSRGQAEFFKNSKTMGADLQAALSDPAYSGAYVKRSIDFDDPEILKEFERNGQDVEEYRKKAGYGIDNSSEPRYSSVRFPGNVFPRGDQFDAHKYAILWAKEESTRSGDRKLAYHNGSWYVIEAFNDMPWGYQIVRRIPSREYEKWRRIYVEANGSDSYADTIDETHALSGTGHQYGRTGYSTGSNTSGIGRKNNEIRGLDSVESDERKTDVGQESGYEGGGNDRQGRDGSPVSSDVGQKFSTVTETQDSEYMELVKDPENNLSDYVDVRMGEVSEGAKKPGQKPGRSNVNRYSQVINPDAITAKDVYDIRQIGNSSSNYISVYAFTPQQIQYTQKWAQKFYRELGVKSPYFRAWFGDWRANDKTPITAANRKGNARGIIHNIDTGWDIQVSGKVFNESRIHSMHNNRAARQYLEYIDSIVKNAVLLDSFAISDNKTKSENSAWMHSLYAVSDIGNGTELLKLYVEELNDVNSDGTIRRAYQLQNIESQRLSAKGSGNKSLASSASTAGIKIVSDLWHVVKQKDRDFNLISSSKIVNADGTPKTVYHGTDADFTMFSYGEIGKTTGVGILGHGFYFTDKRASAKKYGKNVLPCYLEMRNPYHASEKDFYRINETELKNRGYDGIIYEGTSPIYVVFENTQIKSATDNVGTFDLTSGACCVILSAEDSLFSVGPIYRRLTPEMGCPFFTSISSANG